MPDEGSICRSRKRCQGEKTMKILIVVNYDKDHAAACTEQIVQVLEENGCATAVQGYRYQPEVLQGLADCDMVIAVGGDGTIIHTAKAAAKHQKPVLGVNTGKLGFIAGVETDELQHLKRLTTNDFETEVRHMLQVALIRKGQAAPCWSHIALNDVVVSGSLSKIITYQMAISGHKPYHYRADGFIFATATGSTAYSLSAGGPVIEPTMNCMVYTPICPHSLFNRSVIFQAGTEIKVTVPENRSPLYLTVDGETALELHTGDQMVVSGATRQVTFIRLNRRGFYDTVNEKIIHAEGGEPA